MVLDQQHMVNRAGFALVYSWKLNTVCMVRFAPRLMWQWQSRKLASIRTWPTRADASYCQKKLHFQEVLWIWPFYILTMIGRSGRFKIGNKGWGPSVKICSTESCYAPFCQHSAVAFVELIYVIYMKYIYRTRVRSLVMLVTNSLTHWVTLV